jgi:serine protease Do
VAITVGEFEPDKVAAKPAAAEKAPETNTAAQLLGLTVSDLSEALKKELKLRGGVRVDAVAEPALRAGIREGDVITQIANSEVNDTKAFAQVLSKLDKAKAVSVLLRRGEWSQYTVIRPR